MDKVYTTMEEFHTQNAEISAGLPFLRKTGALARELTICGRRIPNRLACQAMEGCDGTVEGAPGELTIRRYQRLAKSGAGIIWVEAAAVMPEGRANPRQLLIGKANLDEFKKLAEMIKETAMAKGGREPVVILQATHSGRHSKPEGTPAPLIAYNHPIFEKDSPIARERIVSDDYLDRVGEALVQGAVLAEQTGFDGVDIKCCHGYLNAELLSAYQRPGRYGGSLSNRTRLLRESISGAMASCGRQFIVTTRLNAYDGFVYPYGFGTTQGGGLTFDRTEPMWLLKELAKMGVELVDITMGNPYANPHVNRPFAHGAYVPPEHPLTGVARVLGGIASLKKEVPSLTVIASALSYLGVAAPHVAAAYVKNGGFDVAGFGRMILAYPEFARDILEKGELDAGRLCVACSKCTEIMRAGGTPGCVVRDSGVYAPIYREYCRKNIESGKEGRSV